MSKDVISEFRFLHIREAGRQTRSSVSWDSLYDSVMSDEAFCVVSRDHQSEFLLLAGLFMTSRNHCTYAISSSRSDLFENSLFHPVTRAAILHSKSLDISWFETGRDVPSFGKQGGSSSTEKERSISLFKAELGRDHKTYFETKDCH